MKTNGRNTLFLLRLLARSAGDEEDVGYFSCFFEQGSNVNEKEVKNNFFLSSEHGRLFFFSPIKFFPPFIFVCFVEKKRRRPG